MDYFFSIAALLSAIYAYTYGQWLKKNGNKTGAFGVFLLVAVSMALTIYHMVTKD